MSAWPSRRLNIIAPEDDAMTGSPTADLSQFDTETIAKAQKAVSEYVQWLADTGGAKTGSLSLFAQDALVHQFAWWLSRSALGTAPAAKQLTAAWMCYWPGAGSVDSTTLVTRSEHRAKRWKEEGAEVTELVERTTSPISANAPLSYADKFRLLNMEPGNE